MARSTMPATWDTFEAAVHASPDRIGFVFSPDDPYFGIDLDKCIDAGEIAPWAQAVINRFPDAYAERSVSDTGVHLIGRGTLPSGGNRKDRIEVYDRARYFTFTGGVLPGRETIGDCSHELAAWHAEMWPPPIAVPPRESKPMLQREDQEVLDQARRATNGERFSALFDRGDVSAYVGDDSAADLALMNILRFWTGGDPVQMERLFSQSALGQRTKWQSRPDYRSRTIERALDSDEVYGSSRGLISDWLGIDEPNGARVVAVLPTAPISSLPAGFLQYVVAGAQAIGVPPEMIALPLMQMAGALVGNRVRIQMKPNFVQYPVLWVALVAEPGSAKSPALDHARRPLDTLQREADERYHELLGQWEEKVELWNRADKEIRGSKPSRPKYRDYFTTNTTIEALVGILETTPGVTVFKDELVSFITSMDQYRGGKGSDRQEYLSMWSGSPIKVNRRGGEPIFVQHPVVGMSGGIVSDRVIDLHDTKGTRDGLVERFILIRCHVVPQPWTDDDFDPALLTPVVNAFRILDSLPPPVWDPDGITVFLDQDAKEVWRDWVDENRRLRIEATGMARGYYAKLELIVPRIALILSMLRNPDNPSVAISAERMADACEWGEFIRAHFHAVMRLVNESGAATVGGLQSRILRILGNSALHEHDNFVSRRTLLQRLGNVRANDLTDALEKLRTAGRVESIKEESATKPRELWRIVTAQVMEFPHTDALAATGTGEEGR